jgi:hypothetical protein
VCRGSVCVVGVCVCVCVCVVGVCVCVCACVCVGTYQFVVFFLCGISDTNLKCAEATDQALQA